MNSKIDKFMNDLKENCAKYDIKLILSKSKSVKLSDFARGAGYFDDYNRELAVSMKRPDWLAVAVHESCHLDQYIENCKIIQIFNANPNNLDEWLDWKKEYRTKTIKKLIDVNRDIELDCEKRTIKKIKLYKLDIDIEEYIQKANAYIHFYNYINEIRRWSNVKNSPYSNPNVWQKMPKKFMPNKYYKTLPDEIRQIFVDEDI